MILDALWREDATEEEVLAAMQDAVNTGMAWRLEGSVGRACADTIESGLIMLGELGHHDYYGNYVPSRYEVVPGSKGSPEYLQRREEEK